MEKIRSGYVIRGYQLKEMIGAGGFSTVYRAESVDPFPLYNSIIAVKILHPRRLERDMIRQFIKEGKIAKMLEHPNIVKVFDVFEEDGNFFIFMECLDTDLMKGIRTKRYIFNSKNLIDIIIKAAKGISYIHQNGIIHKDINPSNVLITYSLEKIKITDFGLSKVGRRIFNGREYKGGTEGYIAPEIYKGERASERSDIYSFGKTVEKIYKELNIPMPEKIKNIIKISTDPDPQNRFESMEGIIYILETRKIE